MQIEQLPIGQIVPYEKNAKLHPAEQVKRVAESIKRFGWAQPLAVDKDNVLIIGHCRLLAAQSLGLKDVPVVRMDKLSEKQIKALRLADNKLNESPWDMELVLPELRELDVDLAEATGFSLDLLVDSSELDNDVPELPIEPITKPGDLYVLGGHRVLCGDSTSLTDVERLMDGTKAQMVFTDPPYNVAYTGKTKEKLKIKNDAMSAEKFGEFCQKFITNLITFTDGAIYVCMSSSEWPTLQAQFLASGGHWSRTIVWVKDRMVLSRADYHTQHEPIAVFNEDENEEGVPILYGWPEGSKRFWSGDRKQTDIWRVKRPAANKEHPTMKPVELCERAIVNSSTRNNTVLDLFLGSGSTLIAAEKTGRRCYGLELDPKYVDVIVKRWEEFTGKKAKKYAAKN